MDMGTRVKLSFISLILLFLFLYAGNVNVNLDRPAYECSNSSETYRKGKCAISSGTEGGNSRKLMGFNAVLDYDYAGPNPKHEPPRGKKGGGTKTP